MTLYFSRLRLSRSPTARALSALITPVDEGELRDARHRLIWTVFGDDENRKRDFLWREEQQGEFLILSEREPIVTNDLFETPEIMEFSPRLARGDVLDFKLRVNATRTVQIDEIAPNGRQRKRKHIDLVMDRLHKLPGKTRASGEVASERSLERMDAAQTVAEEWISRKGEEAGFRLLEDKQGPCLVAESYMTVVLPPQLTPDYRARWSRRGQPQFGVMDLIGRIEVTEPKSFRQHLAFGFGRAKSFGCGLMVIRRAA